MAPDEVVQALFAAFAARDLTRAMELCDPELEFWPQGTAQAAGRDAPYRGHEGMRSYFADVAEQWRELEVVPDDLRVAGSAVVAFGEARGVRVGGEQFAAPVIWTLKLRDGLLWRGRVVATAAEAYDELRRAG